MSKKWLILGGLAVAVAGVLMIPVGGDVPVTAAAAASGTTAAKKELDLSAFSDAAPGKSLRLLFIHHSCGGQMFADPGPAKERANCIFDTHPNGGALRSLLMKDGYEIHEASYGSEIGEKTDLFDWGPKFRDKMDKVLTVDMNDTFFTDGRKNQIVVFKSCYPNNRFLDDGEAPGNPAGPELTVWNAKAALSSLLPEFQKHPDTLFVYLTAPPVAPKGYQERLFKLIAKKILGRPTAAENVAKQGRRARDFNSWVVSSDGWLKDYPLKNVVVFDYYDYLTDGGASNLSRYPTGDGSDSHPSSAGNARAARAFVPFLNRAVRRMGFVQ